MVQVGNNDKRVLLFSMNVVASKMTSIDKHGSELKMSPSPALSPVARRLEGKVAIITGGACGIGAATARLFAIHGAKVVIADIRDDHGQAVSDEIGPDGSAFFVHCDVSKESDVANVVDVAVSRYGKLDIMFNNAGIGGRFDPRISVVDYEDLSKVFQVNVFGSFWGAKHAARVMVPAKRGSILFTSSTVSVCVGDVPHAYVASKHAVTGLAKNLCVELGQHGIRVNCISPYGVVTKQTVETLGSAKKLQDTFTAAGNLKEAVLEAKDVAEAALYLSSDDSKYVSGLNLVVDGGFSTTNVSLGIHLGKMLAE